MNDKSTQKTKSVTFAPQISVRTIPLGEGTWENGQSVAFAPSMWQIKHQDRIAAQTLEEIERQEYADSKLAISSSGMRSEPRKPNYPRPGPNITTPKRKPVPIPSPIAINVTFESFLEQSQISGHEPLKTPTSIKSVTSTASIKSLSRKLKAKLRKR